MRDCSDSIKEKPVVKGSSRALLFETLDADFKLQPFINLPVLEVAELFVNVVPLSDGAFFRL